MSILFRLYALFLILKLQQQGECTMEAMYRKHREKYLANYVFRTLKTNWEQECATRCFRDNLCASVNYKISGIGKGLCEFSNKTLDEASKDGTHNLEFNHLDIIKRDCPEPEQVFSSKTKRCHPIPLYTSCKKLLQQKASLPNGAYAMQLNIASPRYKVYCHMTDIPGCGSGGWTLVLKVNGVKSTFGYDSTLWSNKESYAVEDGLEGLTEKESKLASYWNTPFRKICLGMTVNGDRKWIVLDYEASSLYSLIADGNYRSTSAGRETWKSLIAGSSLQPNCNHEGFNIQLRDMYARLSFVANNENHCNSCDSWIGFGIYTLCCGETSNQACGNRAVCAADRNIEIPAFGYILVQ